MAETVTRKVLITGASVAGNTLAWWLGRTGFAVTVVEQAATFRDGGQNVDVRGEAQEVLRRMGLEQTIKDLGTGERGMRFVNRRDKGPVYGMNDGGAKTFTQELEVLRGDVARVLWEAARKHAAYRFGDAIESIDQDDEGGVLVHFRQGPSERYGLVLVAEGVGSATREMVFPGENQPRWLDMINAYMTIQKGAGDGNLGRWYNTTGGRGLILRPDRMGTTRVLLILRTPHRGEEKLGPEAQKRFLAVQFEGAGWETARVLMGLQSSQDFYMDSLRQVRMRRWSRGRVILCGDAAWCATPISGVGTSLAIMGAYVLAGELRDSPHLEDALANYERIMRPIVEKAQNFPKFIVRLGNPRSRLGLLLRAAVLRVGAAPGIRKIFARLLSSKADKRTLPEYSGLCRVAP